MTLYRNFRTQEEIDREYNLSAQTPELASIFTRYARTSEVARTELPAHLDVRYGPTLDETVDIFPAPHPESPLLMFIHGGYFRSMSSKDFSFVASGFNAAGVSVAVTNYSLCPKVRIDEITRQNRAAVAWLYENAEHYHGDPRKMFVMGHSAGGHQAAMLALTDWPGEYGLPADVIKVVIALSGIYDLEPLRFSFLQPVLQLDFELIRRQSPIHNIPESAPPMLAIVGEREPAEFHRQTRKFASAWSAAGLNGEHRVHPGVNHFTIIEELSRPQSALCIQSLAAMRSCDERSRVLPGPRRTRPDDV